MVWHQTPGEDIRGCEDRPSYQLQKVFIILIGIKYLLFVIAPIEHVVNMAVGEIHIEI